MRKTEGFGQVRLLARAKMPRQGSGIPCCLVLVWTLLSSEVLPILAWIWHAVLIYGLILLMSPGVALFARHQSELLFWSPGSENISKYRG